MKNYFEILGVPYNATDQEIKDAYRFLIKKFHPDANTGKYNDMASEQTKRITEAYEVLSDPERRKQHLAELKAEAASSKEWEDAKRAAAYQEEELRRMQEELDKSRMEKTVWETMFAYSEQQRNAEDAARAATEQNMRNSGQDKEFGVGTRLVLRLIGLACAAITLYLYYRLFQEASDYDAIYIGVACVLPVAGVICSSAGSESGGIVGKICGFEIVINIIFLIFLYRYHV